MPEPSLGSPLGDSPPRTFRIGIVGGMGRDALDELLGATRRLVGRGADVVVAGCTELSMCSGALAGAGVPLVDPLRVLARHLVTLGKNRAGPERRAG